MNTYKNLSYCFGIQRGIMPDLNMLTIPVRKAGMQTEQHDNVTGTIGVQDLVAVHEEKDVDRIGCLEDGTPI